MTVVQIRITVPTITGVNVGAKGKIRWTPTLRRNVDPNTVVLPKGFDVDLVSGEARVTVAPTTINWCWKVEEGLYRVGVPNGTTRYVSVPDSETVINYIDLQDLDPTTLEPTATPAAIWDIELSQVEERVTTLENAPPAHTHDNLDALDQVSGINTGDQDLSGLLTTAAAPELIRNTMGSALVAGDGVTITPDDGADTITIAATGGSSGGVTTALYLPGASGNTVTCPDAAALGITGDLDIRLKLNPGTWYGDATGDIWLTKTGGASSYSWILQYQSGNGWYFRYSTNGSTFNNAVVFGAMIGEYPTDDTAAWIRATFDADNGAGGTTTKYYKSTDDGATWTLMGSKTIPGVAVLYTTGDQPITMGSVTSPALYEAFELRNGIDGTLVAKWDGSWPHTRQLGPGGEIWTVNGTANAWKAV